MDEGGVESLLEKSRRKPNLSNRVDAMTESSAVISMAVEFPAYDQIRASNEPRKRSVFVFLVVYARFGSEIV